MIHKIIETNSLLLCKIADILKEGKELDQFLAEEYWNLAKDLVQRVEKIKHISIEFKNSDSDMFLEIDLLYAISTVNLALFLIDYEKLSEEDENLINSYLFVANLMMK